MVKINIGILKTKDAIVILQENKMALASNVELDSIFIPIKKNVSVIYNIKEIKTEYVSAKIKKEELRMETVSHVKVDKNIQL